MDLLYAAGRQSPSTGAIVVCSLDIGMLRWPLTIGFLILSGLASAAAPVTADFLSPRLEAGWTPGGFRGAGFRVEFQPVFQPAIPLMIQNHSQPIDFTFRLVEDDPTRVPALDRIRFLPPCGPSALENRDGSISFDRIDATHYPIFGIETHLPGDTTRPFARFDLPKGTYLFTLHLNADAMKIQHRTLRLADVFASQGGIPDLLFDRRNNMPFIQKPVP
jgi:hypothetical protein